MKSLVDYFVNRPLVVNVIMFGIIIAGILFWGKIGKEEMPEFAMEWVRATLRYPGASAEDVELFVSKPIEEKLKGVNGLKEVSSVSSYGSSSFRISFEPNIPNLQEKVQEVKDAFDSADLPREVEDPVYRQFRSSEKAIIDIGFYLKSTEELNTSKRALLQKYVLAFKNKILTLPEVSGVEESGYLRPEIQVKVNSSVLEKFEISMDQIRDQVLEKHVRRPIGSLEDKRESDVTIVSELDNVQAFNNVIVSSGFEGQKVKLSELAVIDNGFEKTNAIEKVQGHEGIVINVQKSSSVDILSAQKALLKFVKSFQADNSEVPLGIVLMDDESYDVRNRLEIIGSNGFIGFILIVLVLFIFLDFRSGIWVAMGIPFSLAFTLIAAYLIGYTVNNMTLASIIVVLGVVVDDAIIVAENISRRTISTLKDVTESTMQVLSPIVASVLTTCAAFVPMYFFEGRFGLFVKYLPAIIFFMLGASLIESFFILPSHMSQKFNIFKKIRTSEKFHKFSIYRSNLTSKLEDIYRRFVVVLLNKRVFVLIGFALLLVVTGYVFNKQLKYVMFPREESKDFRVKVIAPLDTTRKEMALKIRSVEDVFLNDSNVVGLLSNVGKSRRGGEVRENEASIRVEVVPTTERKVSLNRLFEIWNEKVSALKGFENIRLLKSRWGSDSGSPIEIEIQENNDGNRKVVVERLESAMKNQNYLANVEVESPISKDEYRLHIRTEEASRLGVNYNKLATVLRSYVEGDILYTIISGEEEVDVRFTSNKNNKDNIEDLLNLTVANNNNYLVPINSLVDSIKGEKPANVQRVNYKRTTNVYADLAPDTKKTPLEIAEIMERDIFPVVTKGYPSTNIVFRGEVEDSRESQGDFLLSVVLVLIIVYILLVFLFNSVTIPLVIGAVIPFGVIGTALAFWAHGFSQYGFFAVVGTLGMVGVVINDSIVLVDKMRKTISKNNQSNPTLFKEISDVSASRLRAVVVTTLTTVAGIFPTAYGLAGYDSMLAEMMLAMGWGLLFGLFVTLILVPCLYSYYLNISWKISGALSWNE